MKSDVYFIKIAARSGIEEKELTVRRLIEAVNPFSDYQDGEIIPVKITIGDSPCIYHLSPQLVKLVVAAIKNKGAKPFLFDTSVIYNGQRQNAVDHLNLVQNKGFGHYKVGAPFIIADGLFGQDGKEFILDSKNINKIKVPSFIGLLDSLLVLSHVTGHIISGYAGAIKNVAMGMSCRSTKQVQHSSLKPSIIENKCTACGCCMAVCPARAISFKNKKSFILSDGQKKQASLTGYINQELCIGCGECLCVCKFDAVFINWHEDHELFCRRMAEVSNLILSKFKKKFFLNFTFDITEECDCISAKDEKMIAIDLGILASNDILSIDKATADLVNRNKKSDFFTQTKNTYETMFAYAAKIGLGNLEYNLIEIN